jgi:hypothetical protein
MYIILARYSDQLEPLTAEEQEEKEQLLEEVGGNAFWISLPASFVHTCL